MIKKIINYLNMYSYNRAIQELDRLNYIEEKNNLIQIYKEKFNNEPETS